VPLPPNILNTIPLDTPVLLIPLKELPFTIRCIAFTTDEPASDKTAPLVPVVVMLLKIELTIVSVLEPTTLINEIVVLPLNEMFDTLTEEKTTLLPPESVKNEYVAASFVLSAVITESASETTPPFESEKKTPLLLPPCKNFK
jgi:hypothetical protein